MKVVTSVSLSLSLMSAGTCERIAPLDSRGNDIKYREYWR